MSTQSSDRRHPGRARDERGAALVELIVAAGIFLLVFASALGVLDAAKKAQGSAQAQARTEKLDELRGALDRMGSEIRQALTVDVDSAAARLTMVSLVSGAQHTIVYELVHGRLHRRVDSGPAGTELARDVTSAIFCFDPPACTSGKPESGGPSLVRLMLVARAGATDPGTVTLSTEVRLRAPSTEVPLRAPSTEVPLRARAGVR